MMDKNQRDIWKALKGAGFKKASKGYTPADRRAAWKYAGGSGIEKVTRPFRFDARYRVEFSFRNEADRDRLYETIRRFAADRDDVTIIHEGRSHVDLAIDNEATAATIERERARQREQLLQWEAEMMARRRFG